MGNSQSHGCHRQWRETWRCSIRFLPHVIRPLSVNQLQDDAAAERLGEERRLETKLEMSMFERRRDGSLQRT